jgi:hypothetical protein
MEAYNICLSCRYYVPVEERTAYDGYHYCKISSLVRNVSNEMCDSYAPNWDTCRELKVCWECKYWSRFEENYCCLGVPFEQRKKLIVRDDPEYMTCDKYEPKDGLPYIPCKQQKVLKPEQINLFEVIGL